MTKQSTRWITAGTCFALVFMNPILTPLIIPGFLLLFQALSHAKSLKHVIGYGFILGLIKGAGVLSWIWYIYPLSWITNQSWVLQISILALYWVSAAAALACGTSIAITGIYLIQRKISWGIYLAPIIWLFGEISGSFIFSILTLGKESTLQTHFSYGYVGYILANIPILQSLAFIGGVYALTLGVVCMHVLLYQWIQQHTDTQNMKIVGVTALLFSVVTVGTYLYHKNNLPQAKGMSVIAVATDFDKTFMTQDGSYLNKRTIAKEAVLAALPYTPNAIILPEDIRFTKLFTAPVDLFSFLHENDSHPVTLITSGRMSVDNKIVLRSFVFNSATDTYYSMDKMYLTPHGEYMPYIHKALLQPFLDTKMSEKLARDISYTRGLFNDYSTLPTQSPAILFCMESSWPSAIYNRTKNRETPYVAYITSHSWFTNPKILWYQQGQILQTQAIWSNTTIISATNMAPQKVYKANGVTEQGTQILQGDYWKLYQVHL